MGQEGGASAPGSLHSSRPTTSSVPSTPASSQWPNSSRLEATFPRLTGINRHAHALEKLGYNGDYKAGYPMLNRTMAAGIGYISAEHVGNGLLPSGPSQLRNASAWQQSWGLSNGTGSRMLSRKEKEKLVEHDQAMLRVHSEWVKAHGPPDSVTRAEKQRQRKEELAAFLQREAEAEVVAYHTTVAWASRKVEDAQRDDMRRLEAVYQQEANKKYRQYRDRQYQEASAAREGGFSLRTNPRVLPRTFDDAWRQRLGLSSAEGTRPAAAAATRAGGRSRPVTSHQGRPGLLHPAARFAGHSGAGPRGQHENGRVGTAPAGGQRPGVGSAAAAVYGGEEVQAASAILPHPESTATPSPRPPLTPHSPSRTSTVVPSQVPAGDANTSIASVCPPLPVPRSQSSIKRASNTGAGTASTQPGDPRTSTSALQGPGSSSRRESRPGTGDGARGTTVAGTTAGTAGTLPPVPPSTAVALGLVPARVTQVPEPLSRALSSRPSSSTRSPQGGSTGAGDAASTHAASKEVAPTLDRAPSNTSRTATGGRRSSASSTKGDGGSTVRGAAAALTSQASVTKQQQPPDESLSQNAEGINKEGDAADDQVLPLGQEISLGTGLAASAAEEGNSSSSPRSAGDEGGGERSSTHQSQRRLSAQGTADPATVQEDGMQEQDRDSLQEGGTDGEQASAALASQEEVQQEDVDAAAPDTVGTGDTTDTTPSEPGPVEEPGTDAAVAATSEAVAADTLDTATEATRVEGDTWDSVAGAAHQEPTELEQDVRPGAATSEGPIGATSGAADKEAADRSSQVAPAAPPAPKPDPCAPPPVADTHPDIHVPTLLSALSPESGTEGAGPFTTTSTPLEGIPDLDDSQSRPASNTSSAAGSGSRAGSSALPAEGEGQKADGAASPQLPSGGMLGGDRASASPAAAVAAVEVTPDAAAEAPGVQQQLLQQGSLQRQVSQRQVEEPDQAPLQQQPSLARQQSLQKQPSSSAQQQVQLPLPMQPSLQRQTSSRGQQQEQQQEQQQQVSQHTPQPQQSLERQSSSSARQQLEPQPSQQRNAPRPPSRTSSLSRGSPVGSAASSRPVSTHPSRSAAGSPASAGGEAVPRSATPGSAGGSAGGGADRSSGGGGGGAPAGAATRTSATRAGEAAIGPSEGPNHSSESAGSAERASGGGEALARPQASGEGLSREPSAGQSPAPSVGEVAPSTLHTSEQAGTSGSDAVASPELRPPSDGVEAAQVHSQSGAGSGSVAGLQEPGPDQAQAGSIQPGSTEPVSTSGDVMPLAHETRPSDHSQAQQQFEAALPAEVTLREQEGTAAPVDANEVQRTTNGSGVQPPASGETGSGSEGANDGAVKQGTAAGSSAAPATSIGSSSVVQRNESTGSKGVGSVSFTPKQASDAREFLKAALSAMQGEEVELVAYGEEAEDDELAVHG